jgi:hypothetical protein
MKMDYQPHPDSKNTPSRKARKGARSTVFIKNAGLAALKRREKKAAKRAAQLAAEEAAEAAAAAEAQAEGTEE